MPQNCTPFQKSLAWCMGVPELPGIRRRIYYISKDQIAKWPPFNRDDNYRAKTAVLTGNFTLVADAHCLARRSSTSWLPCILVSGQRLRLLPVT